MTNMGDYRLGVPAIDADHKILLSLCDEFTAASESGAAPATLAAILDRLIGRARSHFEAEEKLLDRHNYPGLAGHRAEHQRLLTRAENLQGRLAEGRAGDLGSLTQETCDYLRRWLMVHILDADRPSRPFVMSLT